MSVDETVQRITDLEIQGATNVAKAAVKALQQSKQDGADRETLEKQAEKLKNARATEPGLFNAVDYAMETGDFDTALEHFRKAREKIVTIGDKRVPDNGTVYTHCRSSTVTAVLKESFRDKTFDVHNTETRPRFQGRSTAKELTQAGIPVTHFVDSAAREALKDADIMFIGADAVTSKGFVYNKIGSRMIAETAYRMDVPVYVLTDSWKYWPKSRNNGEVAVEQRSSDEVWEDAPADVTVKNPAFDSVNPELIDDIISELGIRSPHRFHVAVEDQYPDVFGNR